MEVSTHIVHGLLLRVSVEMDDLAVVPAPVLLLDVGQVERGGAQALPVPRLHLGYPTVVSGRVEEVCRAVCWIVVIPEGEEKHFRNFL